MWTVLQNLSNNQLILLRCISPKVAAKLGLMHRSKVTTFLGVKSNRSVLL
jgi:hypothetical protein